MAYRPKIYSVEAAQLVDGIGGHHPSGLTVSLAAPVKMLPGKRDVVSPSGSFENAKPFGHHLESDAVSFNDRDVVALHVDLA
jgi:hypothetical protein